MSNVPDFDELVGGRLARIPTGSTVTTNTAVTLGETGIAVAINNGGPHVTTIDLGGHVAGGQLQQAPGAEVTTRNLLQLEEAA